MEITFELFFLSGINYLVISFMVYSYKKMKTEPLVEKKLGTIIKALIQYKED